MDQTTEVKHTIINSTQDSAMMICYRECLTNLEKFNGSDETKAVQFINNIERIGRMIKANDEILHCLCTAKLEGEAKRCYENNSSLNEWKTLKSSFLERFTSSDSTSRTFEQLKERKQRPDESITSYYDDIIKLCHDYDLGMSQKLMISWLENGINESLKISIKRQMKALVETTRTTQTFLKIAKDEQELQENATTKAETTSSFIPYFTNTVSTTLSQPENQFNNHLSKPGHRSMNTQQQQSSSRNYDRTADREIHFSRQRPFSFRHDNHKAQVEHPKSFYRSDTSNRKFDPCAICQKKNHRTIDCYQKKDSGCYKCGQSDHRVRDCLKVFY